MTQAHPEPNNGPTQLIIACRPLRDTDFPEAVRADLAKLAPLDPGGLETHCQLCGMDIVMGPRQRTQFELEPEHFLVLDFLCTARVGANENTPVSHLGGR